MFCVFWDVFIQNQSQSQIDFDSFKIYRRMLFSPLDVVDRGSETQLQVCKKLTCIILTFKGNIGSSFYCCTHAYYTLTVVFYKVRLNATYS